MVFAAVHETANKRFAYMYHGVTRNFNRNTTTKTSLTTNYFILRLPDRAVHQAVAPT